MRILFLAPRLPYPPNRGGEITVFNFLRVLSRAHDISLVSFYDSPEEQAYRPELERYCAHLEMVRRPTKLAPGVLARALCTSRSYAVARHASADFAAAVRRIVATARPELAQFETFLVGQYLNEVGEVPTVLDMHNATWLIWERSVAVSPRWIPPGRASAGEPRAPRRSRCAVPLTCARRSRPPTWTSCGAPPGRRSDWWS